MTETTAEMTNPKIRECAEQLARELHATVERKRTSVSLERYLWDEVPAGAQRLMTETLYSLLYRGIILCPIPEHRIGIDLRSAAAPPATEPAEAETPQAFAGAPLPDHVTELDEGAYLIEMPDTEADR